MLLVLTRTHLCECVCGGRGYVHYTAAGIALCVVVRWLLPQPTVWPFWWLSHLSPLTFTVAHVLYTGCHGYSDRIYLCNLDLSLYPSWVLPLRSLSTPCCSGPSFPRARAHLQSNLIW